jgi:glutamine amidotransferase
MIVVVDYGMGNLRSVAKALAHVAPSEEVVVSSDAAVILRADRVVLPGQSAMPDCMKGLVASGLVDTCAQGARTIVRSSASASGLQMLFDASEEGPTECLHAVSGRVVRFRDQAMSAPGGARLKVPHMGWSPVRQVRPHALWAGIEDGERFYFAHSYHPVPEDSSLTAATVDYPSAFTCAIARANIFATQFHPEKSQRAGLTLLANFVTWDGRS